MEIKIIMDIMKLQLESQGFTVESSTKYYDNGKKLFNGLYNVNFKGETVLRIRPEENNLYTIHTMIKFPTFVTSKENLSQFEIMNILISIRNDIILNERITAISNMFNKRAERGASLEVLEEYKNHLLDIWRHNKIIARFINSIKLDDLVIVKAV